MATEQIGDYPQKMIEFGLHWQSVNTSLGGTPETAFKLAGGYDQAQFMTDRDAIVAKLTEIEGLKNELDFARADRDSLRGDLRQRLILFRSSVKALLAESRYERALPETPAEQADEDRLLSAWDDMAHLWGQINADSPSEVGTALTLRGNYALADFQADVATMRSRYDEVKRGERVSRDARGVRDELLAAALERMSQYRERLPLVLEPDAPLLASMPELYPSNGGGDDPEPADPLLSQTDGGA